MSSPLSTARCVRVDGREAWIRLEPHQALTLPHSDRFALALVAEALREIVYARPGQRWPRAVDGPLRAALRAAFGAGDDADAFEALVDGWSRDRADPVAATFVRCRGYRDVAGFPLPPSLVRDPDGVITPAVWWRSDAERAAGASAVARAFEAWQRAESDRVHRGGPAPTGPRPTATLVIEAAQPSWLAHLAEGMLWDSYVYDDDAQRQFP